MIELPFLLMAGVLGSSHCLGMCGGFALAISSGATSWKVNLRRQLEYTVGRVFTYTTFGAVAGYCGWRLAHLAPLGINLSAGLAILAGAILIYQGLAATGWVRRRSVSGSMGSCPGPSLFASLLALPGPWRPLLAGVFTGFLPCGLLYGMLALAASTHEWSAGMATMAVFGIGTAPGMIVAGWGGSLMTMAARRRVWTFAAWCLVVAGTLSAVRGAVVLLQPNSACPWCHGP